MDIQWNRILPVIVSIAVIITVAILRNYSRSVAAIAAVMPINIPLGMWIIYAGEEDKHGALADFNKALLIGILPTILFMIVAWQLSKAEWDIVPIIVVGYVCWALGLGIMVGVQQLVG
jgi:hypothetical protein